MYKYMGKLISSLHNAFYKSVIAWRYITHPAEAYERAEIPFLLHRISAAKADIR